MHLKIMSALLVVVFVLLSEADAWWVFGGGSSSQCPSRGGASPYYFGTTNLFCMAGKRGAPARGTWALSHRFIYYKGYYFEFLSSSKASISTQRQAAGRCSGGRESSPAGYSELSLECIKGCAKNYRCHFGTYSLLGNNCHKFANRLSEVLCTRGTSCPSWCQGSCNDAVYG
ncbi:uncharacterized protein [Magallana gigas]|uniref:Uncharacterized protein n=1 Tax=Magallana gigas TaxID=29159 RepID=A0A8W8IVU3_MAGGI|nr:uncharacterized protein LOC105324337 [Crassostrea gigas]|eukprot:XP_011421702.1 PREDICTED: uncharacterized protein LOC105324337 [Crassostrea gigas]